MSRRQAVEFSSVWIYLQWNFVFLYSWCLLKTLSPHISLLQRSVLQMDFLQLKFRVVLYYYWKWEAVLWILPWLKGARCTQTWQNGSQCEHTAFANISFEKLNKKLLIEAHQRLCVPADFWRLYQVFIMKQLHHMLLFCLLQSHKGKGGTKLSQ